ncbi:uncharacterized protein KY384_008490 [Bacidia gigantensis]|uniref:uncharacterized protein n=1 Tax=Bacidia gigantensis TaxID=2732470 RepID=UPI001D03D565|nr:uncharacterized protein KY384_008490 [Bacidia gigantensis]KAG8527061.1 hypothetical protein KY384_008490 [Bacidia gigantensis]
MLTLKLAELQVGYTTIALEFSITGKVPAQITNEIPNPLPFTPPAKLRIIRRCTLFLSDPSQNYRLPQLSTTYDLFALRPTTEKALQLACYSLECDLISLDFSIRHPFYFPIKTIKSALERGIKFEICYGPGVLNADGGASRRNLISNATQLIRATRGKGIVISSEAKEALACRSPADIINLAALWGLPQERGTEAVGREARSVVVQAEMKRRSYRGVIDVLHGGEEPERDPALENSNGSVGKNKRKADTFDEESAVIANAQKPLSKRQQKRQAKQAR